MRRAVVCVERQTLGGARSRAVAVGHRRVVEHAAVVRRARPTRVDCGSRRRTRRRQAARAARRKSEMRRTIVGVDARTRAVAVRRAVEAVHRVVEHASCVRHRASLVFARSRVLRRRRRRGVATHARAVVHHRRAVVGAVFATLASAARRAVEAVHRVVEDAAEVRHRTTSRGRRCVRWGRRRGRRFAAYALRRVVFHDDRAAIVRTHRSTRRRPMRRAIGAVHRMIENAAVVRRRTSQLLVGRR